jgi:hypothetical protein
MEFLDLLRFLLIFAIIDFQYLSYIKKIFYEEYHNIYENNNEQKIIKNISKEVVICK